MPRFLASSPVVAYASMVISTRGEESDFEFLRRWCSKVPMDIEILADEFHPSALDRPFWNDLLNEIEKGAITTLIVPSLFHIVGDDVIALSKFMTFLKIHRVNLKSIVELIDSRRDSHTEIILRLIQDAQKSASARSVI